MPREREEFFRESNTTEREKIFVLAFEGNITEEKYFYETNNKSDDLVGGLCFITNVVCA